MAFKPPTYLYRILPFLLSGTALSAALIRPLDDLKVIEIPISRESLTRISVKDDRIFHVFGVAGEYVLEADEDQGQVFIRPNSLESNSKSISLTLTTEGGHTQDLRLMPRDQAPEALILTKPDEDKDDLLKVKTAPAPISRDEVETLLEACQEGRIPLGYKVVPVSVNQAPATENPTKTSDSSPLAVKISPLTAKLVRELKGDSLRENPLRGNPLSGTSLRALTYEIKNTTKETLSFSEAEFTKKFEEASRLEMPNLRVIAILMTQKNLNPGEGGYVHVVTQLSY